MQMPNLSQKVLHIDVEIENKLCFVYQLKYMQQLYIEYGTHLVLSDAAHKVSKYSLPLFFLVVQNNVHFQLASVIVVEDESSDLLIQVSELM